MEFSFGTNGAPGQFADIVGLKLAGTDQGWPISGSLGPSSPVAWALAL
jgi:hypothetical protein